MTNMAGTQRFAGMCSHLILAHGYCDDPRDQSLVPVSGPDYEPMNVR